MTDERSQVDGRAAYMQRELTPTPWHHEPRDGRVAIVADNGTVVAILPPHGEDTMNATIICAAVNAELARLGDIIEAHRMKRGEKP